ncbi:MAG: ribonucleoside triphosphate reductase [Alphaproteobacteria bacterium]|nr:ribonucleoside triphosphate reductase [Alphaproteobacteria bacterium]
MKQNISYVIKRNGLIENFNKEKIINTIHKATKTNPLEINGLTNLVISKLEDTASDIKVKAESISSVIAETLALINNNAKTNNNANVHANKNSTGGNINAGYAVREYIDNIDWRVHANANLGYSLGGLILNLSGKVIANYWLNNVYHPKVSAAHVEGFLHIHDLDMLSGYCAGWSLKMLLTEGFNGVVGKIESTPPKHLSTALGQMVNFLGTLQNEWAGAQAFSSFDTYLAPFVKIDNMSYDEVYHCIQSFIFNMNVPTRWGTQTPFSNVTLDWTCPEGLRDEHPIIGGTEVDFTYGDLQKEMDIINKAFIQTMIDGDAKGRIFTFPIPTYNITKDFNWDGENTDLLFEMTAKYGIPYFQNFVNSDLSPNMIRSMCCRLQLDLRELLKRGNGLFGSAEQTGSVGVVTINCARLGYLHKGNLQLLYNHLEELLELSKSCLETKRNTVVELMNKGLYPYTKRYLGTFKNHFSTIGVNGINEMVRNFTNDKHDISDHEGKELAIKVLDFIRAKLVKFQVQTGHLYNLEATPAEGCMYRFAREDKKRYPDIIQAGNNVANNSHYYTNSSQLPVGYTDDLFEALDHQEELQRKYTGGTVVHLYMGERMSSGTACKNLVRKVLSKYKIPYITVTPTFSICPKHGYLAGEHEYCPKCDDEIIYKKLHKEN